MTFLWSTRLSKLFATFIDFIYLHPVQAKFHIGVNRVLFMGLVCKWLLSVNSDMNKLLLSLINANQSTDSTDWSIVSDCRLGKWFWTGT